MHAKINELGVVGGWGGLVRVTCLKLSHTGLEKGGNASAAV